MSYDTKLFNDKIFKIRATTVAPVAVSNLGDIRYADGSGWNPSDGEGYYFWDGEAWVPMFSRPYEVACYSPDKPTSSMIVLLHVFVKAITFPASFTGSKGKCNTAATAQTDFDLQKNGSSFGTMRFAASGTTATFVGISSSVSFAIGDILKVVAPASADATLSDLYFTFQETQ